jgi:SAM-dependent methyltransferase
MKDSIDFDQYAENYDAHLNRALAASGEGKEFFARGRVEWLARCLKDLNQNSRKVIDYGCGVGDTTTLLLELLKADSAVGLDISERSLELARRNHSAACQFLTFGEHSPDGSTDVVYCNGVFHHIPPNERSDSVRYVYECLQPGGVFALWENNPWNPGTQYVMFRCEFDRDAVKIPSPEARRLLRDGGFEILRTDFRFFFPRFLRALRPLEDSLSRVPLGGQYMVLGRKPRL